MCPSRFAAPAARILPGVRHAALVLVLLGPAATLPAVAQDPVVPSQAIPAGSLATVLTQWALSARVLLTFTPDQVAGRSSPGLQAGSHTIEAALSQLLLGTGLQARQVAAGSYVLQPVPSLDEHTLEPVSVTSNQLGDITEGTGSWTTGAMATATRLVLSSRETPQSISLVTRQEMDDFQLTAIDDVMVRTPGVNVVTYDSERTEYYARGFAIQNFQYDGMPMSRNTSYSAGNTLSDMAIYDRVEVLKGATGLLTGSGSPGATINLIRKKPTYAFQGHLSAAAGRWDDTRTELDVSGPLGRSTRLRGRAVAAWQERSSRLQGYQRESLVLYGILELDLTPNTLLTVGADYQDNDPTHSTWGGIAIYNANGDFNRRSRSFNNGARWSRWEQYTRTVFSTLEHSFDNGWVARLQLNHQINGYDAPLGAAADGHPDPLTGGGAAMWAGKYVGRTRANAADAYASGPFVLLGRRHELVLGGSLSNRLWTNRGYRPEPGYEHAVGDYYGWTGRVPEPQWEQHYGNRETTRERGAYATARFNLREDLKLITGLRVSDYRDADTKENGVPVPYAGLVYDLNDQWSVYGNHSAIFKPQSDRDEAGRRLDPLEGISQEVGLKAELLDRRLNASLAWFRLDQDNYAEETGGTTPEGNPAHRAVDGVRTRGYELELAGHLNERWHLHGGFTHKVARLQGSKVDTLVPENTFSLYTAWRFGEDVRGLTLGGGARWQDRTWGEVAHPTLGTVRHTVPDYWLVDLMARYRFSRNLSATLNVNNVFDKRYYTIFSWYSTYTWGEARHLNLNVTWNF